MNGKHDIFSADHEYLRRLLIVIILLFSSSVIFFFSNETGDYGMGYWELLFMLQTTVPYAHVFFLHYTTKCTQRLWGIGTLVSQAQHIQDMFWLTHHYRVNIKDKYSKWINSTSITYKYQSRQMQSVLKRHLTSN